jgi:hypothetical protein
MATKKKPATKAKATKAKTVKNTVKTRQLPSPLTPILAVVAAIFTYISFSLAIDSGSYWHYGFGFYFIYQTVRLTKVSIRTRINDKAKRATKA